MTKLLTFYRNRAFMLHAKAFLFMVSVLTSFALFAVFFPYSLVITAFAGICVAFYKLGLVLFEG